MALWPMVGRLWRCRRIVLLGFLAYALCRRYGQKAVDALLSKDEQTQDISSSMITADGFLRFPGGCPSYRKWSPAWPASSHVGSVCGPCPFSRECTHGTHICLGGAFGRRKPDPSLLISALAPPILWWLIGKRLTVFMERKESRPLTGRPSTQRGSSRIEEGETTEGRALCDWQAPEGFPTT